MKKITIFSLHLGYGGIEKSIVNLANLLSNEYQVEIVSTYKLEDTPAFEINDKVKVTYLIDKYQHNTSFHCIQSDKEVLNHHILFLVCSTY